MLTQIEFSLQIFKNTKTLNFMKILPVEAELFHADGQTDMARLAVTIHYRVNAPEETLMATLTL
jgi:hypothetical protein